MIKNKTARIIVFTLMLAWFAYQIYLPGGGWQQWTFLVLFLGILWALLMTVFNIRPRS